MPGRRTSSRLAVLTGETALHVDTGNVCTHCGCQTAEGAAGTYRAEPITKNYAAQNVSDAMWESILHHRIFNKGEVNSGKNWLYRFKKISDFSLQCINVYSINRQIYRIKIFKG